VLRHEVFVESCSPLSKGENHLYHQVNVGT
jgi:hypothetical protein